MTLDEKQLNDLPTKQGFRLRGTDMTRLETYSDAAFAFATTLLVISVGSLPESYPELILALKGVPAFAASFILLTSLWLYHREWSRRYGLEDRTTILISLSLIFIMLVYVYPLKMICSALFAWLSGGWMPTSFVLTSSQELINLFIIYGLGYAALMLMFTLLYRHSLGLANELLLNDLERLKTKEDISSYTILAATGFISAGFAWLMPTRIAVWAGFVYVSLPFIMPFKAVYYARKAQKLTKPKK